MTTPAPVAGKTQQLAPDLQCILAPNPSPMTYWGTNTYILGRENIAIIDPGPDSDAHLNAIQNAIGSRKVSHIVVTHNHLDHSPLAQRLSKSTGAPVFAFGTHLDGRSEIMAELENGDPIGGGEGIDKAFAYDHQLQDGDNIKGDAWQLRVIHTPGHIGNHICLAYGDIMFTGDHVMGWASSLVSPPDGDLTDFMNSCEKLKQFDARIYYPGHGAPVKDPKARLNWLITHRRQRESQILDALRDAPKNKFDITRKIYVDAPDGLMQAAERNVFAHLIDLHQRGYVLAEPCLSQNAIFKLNN